MIFSKEDLLTDLIENLKRNIVFHTRADFIHPFYTNTSLEIAIEMKSITNDEESREEDADIDMEISMLLFIVHLTTSTIA